MLGNNSNLEIFNRINETDEKIDAHANNFADKYNPDLTYVAGDLRIYNNALWRAKQNIDVAEPWTESHWESTNITEVIGSVYSSLNSSLTPTEIEIETTIDGIHAYRMGRQVFVFMENMNRPAWSAGYIATGLPNPINNFVAVGYKGNPFSFGGDGIYSDGNTSSGWESFATSYITAE